ncbi:related to RSM22 - mitochondrial ribosomal protein, small subunit [Cephalotrichum gorgonifer]|uniref:Related to RSM22 - mitochondrial ribosomal protein, small subunit n=1 Tax=Cephalotrichum gorgonifer TaxID=2041049 RepID=A0AAE8MVV6_9PEZI|nr:related to RSM22 - mitochondrial ribosomal protein, small subunit [Cephalotrichum gorgonifer]
MIAARGARNVCPICRTGLSGVLEVNRGASSLRLPWRPRLSAPIATRRIPTFRSYSVANTQPTSQNSPGEDVALIEKQDIERTVREAKQRFRDTLPKGYLTDEEYALYERLYGPPLRETDAEDVGIPHHADLGPYPPTAADGRESLETTGTEVTEAGDAVPGPLVDGEDLGDGYVGIVARNRREYDALMKLQNDFKAAAKLAKEMEAQEELDDDGRGDALAQEMDDHYSKHQRPEEFDEDDTEAEFGPRSRSHPLTEQGHFGPHPSTVQIPRRSLVEPVARLLGRTDLSHVKEAAEKAYGGAGLPDSAITPPGQRNRPMLPMTLSAGHHRMSEIDADAFISVYLPQMYAASRSVLVEVRKRLGTDWIQSLLTRNGGEGPRILDAGSGGAGLAAWQDIIEAEWDVMKDEGKASDANPPGKRSVVIGSENLRNRVSQFLQRTTFLPRLPDYHHSADNAERLLDGAPKVPQARKTYDVILASHLLLQMPEGHRRKAILNSLWSLLDPNGGVLIVLEKGHPRGFEAVAEVRSKLLSEYILHANSLPDQEDIAPEFKRIREEGMIVAPCTNHKECPMYLIPGKVAGRKDVCSFSQRFIRPPFLHRIMDGRDRNHDDVEFSYVAVRRGATLPDGVEQGVEAADRAFAGYETAAAGENPPHSLSLPRNVTRPLKRHGHVLLDVCTPAAKIERWIVPQSYGRQAYRDARKAKWGDLWALGAKTRTERKVRLGRGAGVKDDGGVRARRAKEAGKQKVFEIGYDEGGLKDAVERGAATSRKGGVERRSKGRNRIPKSSLLDQLMDE